MAQYQCSACYFPYDETLGLPDEGIAPGTLWADVPEDFVCPDCGTPKSNWMQYQPE
ncbi:rubredoxin [Azoarcus sp. L1K30]|uniref:rubredoxin n=1 Tax=Azoarcus sp. L1K30 TaxID=2820277 RepID=UPI001B82B0AC|nr:rubredoxin [Azoarcus sp. L1K30]MBR0568948.1 rubredoxin [Azoarcus sp. L1K30]